MIKKIFTFKWWKVLLLFLLLLVIGGAIYLQPYQPEPTALQAMKMTQEDGIVIDEQSHWISFTPLHPVEPAVIFYPGGLVNEQAYAPFARALADAGHPTYIVKMPLDLAVLAGDRAEEIVKKEPYLQYVIGGHSLGGVMAARYTVSNPEKITGVFFLGSYADEKGSLAKMKLPVLSIVASNDKVLNWTRYEESKVNLPANTQFEQIEGGNHSQFGSYGFQKGDGTATISGEQQMKQIVDKILQWLP